MILNEDGLHQYWNSRTTDEKVDQSISFQDFDHVLIGLIAKPGPIHQDQTFYRLNALLILMHNDDYIFQEIHSSKELYEWMKR